MRLALAVLLIIVPSVAQDTGASLRPAAKVLFNCPVQVSNSPDDAEPSITADNAGHVYVGWMDKVGWFYWSGPRLRTSVSKDSGCSFSAPATIEHSLQDPSLAMRPDGKPIFAFTNGLPTIAIAETPDGGMSWSTIATLSYPDAAFLDRPWIAADSKGTLHLVFDSYQSLHDAPVWYIRSTDGGHTWSERRVIKDDTLPQLIGYPGGLRVGRSGVIATVLVDITSSDAFVYRSTDGGTTWKGKKIDTPDTPVFRFSRQFSGNPRVEVSNRNVYAVWGSEDSNRMTVYFARWLADAEAFEVPVAVSADACDFANLPAIAVDAAGAIHVTWLGRKPNADWFMFHTRSIDGGKTFEPAQPITGELAPNAGYSHWPGHFFETVATDHDLYVAWAGLDHYSGIHVSVARNIVVPR